MSKLTPILTMGPVILVGAACSAAPVALTVTAVAAASLAFLGSVMQPKTIDNILENFFKADGHPQVAVLPVAFLAAFFPTAGVPLAAVVLGAQIARSLGWNRGVASAICQGAADLGEGRMSWTPSAWAQAKTGWAILCQKAQEIQVKARRYFQEA